LTGQLIDWPSTQKQFNWFAEFIDQQALSIDQAQTDRHDDLVERMINNYPLSFDPCLIDELRRRIKSNT